MLKPVSVTWGADPEGFFSKDGVIIGSEKVLPEAGLKSGTAIRPHVVLDGVQFELNPPSRNSVPLLGREVSTAFELLSRHLKKGEGQIKLDWRGLVEVSKDELESLSDKSRILGCMPSKNIFGARPIKVSKTYRKRSAGGHLHIGLLPQPKLMAERNDLVPLLAIFVGNTSVLLDRDPGAAERRKNYGRAGEFRQPKHGLEYRAPSNFWLRNYSLMSFVFGMANIALSVANHKFTDKVDIEPELVQVVNIQKVIRAIETNDFDLALENFETVRPFLAKHLPQGGFQFAPDNLDRFVTLAQGVKESGLNKFFPADPIDAWAGPQVEFSTFLNTLY